MAIHRSNMLLLLTILLAFSSHASATSGSAGVVYSQIAGTGPLSTYSHPGVPAHAATVAALTALSPFPVNQVNPILTPELRAFPVMPQGLSGPGIDDFDNDCDLDFIVTNNQGVRASYYKNLLV